MSRIELRLESPGRRNFLGNLLSASALVIGARILPLDLAEAAGFTSEAAAAAWTPSVYLGLEADGTVIIVTHRSEMGTGIRSVLPVVVADELEADWKRVKIEQAIGDAKYGSQNTDGSCSIRDFYDAMREAGATTRTMLERAAAEKWGVPVAEVKAQNHKVVHAASQRELGYGELVALAAKQAMPEENRVKAQTSQRIPLHWQSPADD